MSSRRPPYRPGGHSPGASGPPEDTPAQTNLGLLLQRALQQQAAQESVQPAAADEGEEADLADEARHTKPCADCWNALTFKGEGGRQMARCAKDLWVKPAVTYEELNANKVRRWYGDCPEFDDSE